MTFEVSQVMGNFSLWIRHRLADHMKSRSNKLLLNMDTIQQEDHGNQNHEDAAQRQSVNAELVEGIDDALIAMSRGSNKVY